MSKLKICVYAICKNEEQFVERWYNSMKEADYVVCVDTGSVDDTASKLKNLGAFVERFIFVPFRFDVARNRALSLCPPDTDIFVSTDLDEVFEPGWADELRNNWNPKKHIRCVYKYSWSHLDNGKSARVFQYDKIHGKGWTWQYPVHETLGYIANNRTPFYSEDATLNLFDKIHLHHYPDKTKSRGDYLNLLELRKQLYPDDHYGRIYLAHEYFYRKRYTECISEVDSILSTFSDRLDSIETASLYLFKADAYTELDQKFNAITNYFIAISKNITYREAYLGLAKCYLKFEQYANAISMAKIALSIQTRHFTWFERDTSWNYEPYDILSLAEYYNGNKKEALSYAIKAYSFDEKNERLLNNINSILHNLPSSELIK